MEKKPITSSLFRFVTLRTPQLADERKREFLFVSYPKEKESESIAHRSVAKLAPTEEKERVEALANAYTTENFQAIENRQYLKNEYAKLYDFSNWLMRNKNYFTAQSILENINVILYSGSRTSEVTPTIENSLLLNSDDEVLLWNNLFYQTIHKISTPVRETIVQMLIANRFLKAFNEVYVVFQDASGNSGERTENITRVEDALTGQRVIKQSSEATIVFTEQEKKEFVLRANASVIIPKEVLYSPKNENINTTENPNLTFDQKNFLEKATKVDQAKLLLETYETALDEVNRAELVYNKEEAKKYEQAVIDHQRRVANSQASITIDGLTNPDNTSSDVVSTEDIPGVTPNEYIRFDYVKSPEIIRPTEGVTLNASEAKILAQMSTATLALINSSEFEIYDTFAEVKTLLRTKIDKENRVIIDNTQRPTQNTNTSGIANTTNSDVSPSYAFSIVANNITFQTLTTFDLNINVNDISKKITGVSYEIKNDENSFKASNSEFRVLNPRYEEDEKIKIFPKGLTVPVGTYNFKGEVTFSDGTIVAFDADITLAFKNSVLDGATIGLARIINSGNTSVDIETPEQDNTIYGVTQLGIADFRRVEQEVCCYVPGEVSHIENVMAREYKERNTRNLTSSENITEQNSEREAEVLTDTTSTERNELQNEASSIVNEDNATNFGANASVTGGIGTTFSFGSSVNTSSSNATSDSNLRAQTYAQEVTERALERVVEKVSKKRTTRVLKEYEENITHGFDNRKGDEHVTGVYRWVDIIYKNKLVNYGKRLMYEFTIPEPAKFYVESIFKNNENNDQNNSRNNLISFTKPINPKDLVLIGLTEGLKNASQINEANYQRIASTYNAEVAPFPKQLITVGKSFSLSYTKSTSTNESANLNGKVELPEGYKSTQATVGYSATDNGDSSRKGFYIHIGNKKIGEAGSSSPLHKDGIPTNIDNYINEVPVSAVLFNYFEGALNVSVNCVRTNEYYQQWQNETFNAIMNAYYDRVQEYNEFRQAQEVSPEEKEKQKEFSSQLNRGIEKRELKRIAIDLMTAPFIKKFTVSQNHYQNDNITINNRKVLNDHGSVVKFFEQAFDWEIMAYTFYPYFYKNQSDWGDNFEYLDTNDPIFKAFLQSGMARSVVPVQPGFEDAVNWFMSTGELWGGQGMITDIEDDLYVSISEEMTEPEGVVEGEPWETRVPTALTILQADSVVLKEGGLPCNSDCNEHHLFETSTYKLGDGNSGSTPSSKGVDFDIVGETNTIQ
ncbi:hypothetical protein [Tenacibaculum jejuense]|uniref:Uncharacterized protein n=1 Tax=Tenacibaculum jejuense TaxID=584609 RepID=A0A238UEV1_9FLAO|nr:hypothetical protein [Tenacibaculum jejuense]SNR17733.1 conserved protein of unknown function [Tenacibaculum jejuense]